MRFTTTYRDHEIVAAVYSNSINRIIVPDIGDKEFETVEKAQEAIEKFILTVRKSFVNKTAYVIRGHGQDRGVIEVEVTSITEDGGDVWIRFKDSMGKKNHDRMPRRDVYADRRTTELYLEKRQAEEKRHDDAVDEIQRDLWHWKPEYAEAKKDPA